MLTLDPAIESLITGRSLFLASLFSVTRTDGTVLRFAAHDRAITFGGVVYEPAGGLTASARERPQGLDDRNVEVRGVITSTRVTDEDLSIGLYRDAKVEEYVVDWRFPWMGAIDAATYWIDKASWDAARGQWTADMTGLTRFIKAARGASMNRTCEYRLGQAIVEGKGCGVDLAPFTATGEVVSVTTPRQAFTTDLGATAGGNSGSDDEWFTFGDLTWTTGLNTGRVSEVRAHVVGTGAIALRIATPYDVVAGDQFSVHAGCNRLSGINNIVGHCKNKFANLDQYGGYPTIPGTDTILRTPSR